MRGRARARAALRGRIHVRGQAPDGRVLAVQALRDLALAARRNEALDIAGAGAQLRVHTGDAPLRGRFEMSYRDSVNDTIGGGASEIQKNIIARRKLGLPKNF